MSEEQKQTKIDIPPPFFNFQQEMESQVSQEYQLDILETQEDQHIKNQQRYGFFDRFYLTSKKIITYWFFIYPIILYEFFLEFLEHLIKCNFSGLLVIVSLLLLVCTVLYILLYSVIFFFSDSVDNIYIAWFLDCFFFFLSHIMIFSIVSTTKSGNYNCDFHQIKSDINHYDDVLLVFRALLRKSSVNSLIVDLPNEEKVWTKEYQRIITKNYQLQVNSQRYNTFANVHKHTFIEQFIGYQLISGMNRSLDPHFWQFIVLQLVALLKTLFCLFYIIFHSSSFGWGDIYNVAIITVFTANEIFCLNMILNNNDLRRKTLMINNINKSIVIAGPKVDYSKVIDITDNLSIETWDNTRRVVYEFFSKQMHEMEKTYICLFIFYIFNINVILAAYGETYLFINKESVLLRPLSVISSTFTFVLINMIFFYRIYFGTKFNETIGHTEDNIDILIGFYQDLLQLYDFNFNRRKITKNIYIKVVQEKFREHFQSSKFPDFLQLASEEQPQNYEETKSQLKVLMVDKKDLSESFNIEFENKTQQLKNDSDKNQSTCFDLLVSKFKFASEYYIRENVQYQGRLYKPDEEAKLQKKMIKICLESFQRIKQQIHVDQRLQSYKILNLIKLNFRETLFTLLLCFATVLPQIISKFVQKFTMDIN